MKIEITIPTNSAEVPLHRYQEFMKATREGAEITFEFVLKSLSGCSDAEAKAIKAVDVQRSLNALTSTLSDTEHPLIRFYVHEGVKYGVEPQLDQITFGNLVDIATFVDDAEMWHKVLAILYRPVIRETKKMGGLYAIEKHDPASEGYANRQEVFRVAPTSLWLGVRDFFLNGSIALNRFTMDSLTHQDIMRENKMRGKNKYKR